MRAAPAVGRQAGREVRRAVVPHGARLRPGVRRLVVARPHEAAPVARGARRVVRDVHRERPSLHLAQLHVGLRVDLGREQPRARVPVAAGRRAALPRGARVNAIARDGRVRPVGVDARERLRHGGVERLREQREPGLSRVVHVPLVQVGLPVQDRHAEYVPAKGLPLDAGLPLREELVEPLPREREHGHGALETQAAPHAHARHVREAGTRVQLALQLRLELPVQPVVDDPGPAVIQNSEFELDRSTYLTGRREPHDREVILRLRALVLEARRQRDHALGGLGVRVHLGVADELELGRERVALGAALSWLRPLPKL